MREQIIRRLAATRLPVDPVREAEAAIPVEARNVWFKLPLQPAAVLLPLIEREGSLNLLLTERTHELADHPGQVALPGGRAEECDVDLTATALREAEEEIGLPASAVNVVGYAPAQPVISGYAVVPVIGFVEQPFTPVLDEREVSALFDVPVTFFMDDRNGRILTREREGIRADVWEYQWEDHRVWGATANIIREFLTLIT